MAAKKAGSAKTGKKTTKKKKTAAKAATKKSTKKKTAKKPVPKTSRKKTPAKKVSRRKAVAAVDPTYDEIAARAYVVWERKGRSEGRDMENWREAEAELRAERGLV